MIPHDAHDTWADAAWAAFVAAAIHGLRTRVFRARCGCWSWHFLPDTEAVTQSDAASGDDGYAQSPAREGQR